VIGSLTLRMSGQYLPLATIAWSIALYYLFGSVEMLGKYDGISDVPSIRLFGWNLGQGPGMYGLIWGAVALAGWGMLNLLDSRPRRAIRSLSGGGQMPEAMDVDTARLKITVFVIASLLASVSGWLFAHFQRVVNPTPFGVEAGLMYVIMLVAGGMTSVWGAVLGRLSSPSCRTVCKCCFRCFWEGKLIVFGLMLVLGQGGRRPGIPPTKKSWYPSRVFGTIQSIAVLNILCRYRLKEVDEAVL
jgi:branched-chain amino acid transport system permease protein